MKKVSILLLVFLCMGAVLAGCTGVAEGPAERHRRFDQINEANWRQAVDDWDYFWLYDRNMRMTWYHPRIGH